MREYALRRRPFAIETGLVIAQPGETKVRVYNDADLIEAIVQTPGGRVAYDGATTIDGVEGTAAPIKLSFLSATGSKTGKLLPSGHAREAIDGLSATLSLRHADVAVVGGGTRIARGRVAGDAGC